MAFSPVLMGDSKRLQKQPRIWRDQCRNPSLGGRFDVVSRLVRWVMGDYHMVSRGY